MRPYARLKKKAVLAITVEVVANGRQGSHVDEVVVVPVRAAPLPLADGKFQDGGNCGRAKEAPPGLQRQLHPNVDGAGIFADACGKDGADIGQDGLTAQGEYKQATVSESGHAVIFIDL